MRAISRDGYGWTEFIDHTGCADQEGCKRFFRRAGAWLALFHCFAANDMHQENMIAAGDHPVPIDLETILQATTEEHKDQDPEDQAFDAAIETVANSVMMVGLLPAYGRSPDNNVFAIGGMTADWNSKTELKWNNINSDEMRPAKSKEVGKPTPNLPHVDGRYAKFGDHIDDFIAGFADYAKFLLHQTQGRKAGRTVRRFCRRSGPQGHSPHPILLHAAPAPQKSSDHGRRRDLVRTSRFHRQAGGLGERFRSFLAIAAGRTVSSRHVECAAFRVAQRWKRDPRCDRHFDSQRGQLGYGSRSGSCSELR